MAMTALGARLVASNGSGRHHLNLIKGKNVLGSLVLGRPTSTGNTTGTVVERIVTLMYCYENINSNPIGFQSHWIQKTIVPCTCRLQTQW